MSVKDYIPEQSDLNIAIWHWSATSLERNGCTGIQEAGGERKRLEEAEIRLCNGVLIAFGLEIGIHQPATNV